MLWQADLRVSWRLQWISLSLHAAAVVFILLLLWPLGYRLLGLILLSLLLLDCVRNQRRIHTRQGEIKLLVDFRLYWQGSRWRIVGSPWIVSSGMMLSLRGEKDGRRQHLCLVADSMDVAEWRDLRRLIMQPSGEIT